MVLTGGRKHENQKNILLRHGTPNLSQPQGTHGVCQINSDSLDVEIVKNYIRKTFFRNRNHPGIDFQADIHFQVVDNGDGTAEVAFEVQD